MTARGRRAVLRFLQRQKHWASEARQGVAGFRGETVCNLGIGLPIVHRPRWATELCTGGREIKKNLTWLWVLFFLIMRYSSGSY